MFGGRIVEGADFRIYFLKIWAKIAEEQSKVVVVSTARMTVKINSMLKCELSSMSDLHARWGQTSRISSGENENKLTEKNESGRKLRVARRSERCRAMREVGADGGGQSREAVKFGEGRGQGRKGGGRERRTGSVWSSRERGDGAEVLGGSFFAGQDRERGCWGEECTEDVEKLDWKGRSWRLVVF